MHTASITLDDFFNGRRNTFHQCSWSAAVHSPLPLQVLSGSQSIIILKTNALSISGPVGLPPWSKVLLFCVQVTYQHVPFLRSEFFEAWKWLLLPGDFLCSVIDKVCGSYLPGGFGRSTKAYIKSGRPDTVSKSWDLRASSFSWLLNFFSLVGVKCSFTISWKLGHCSKQTRCPWI